jgi:sarcosine oxidase gamma subunit
MSRQERSCAASARLAQLLADGAHAAARRVARATLADPAAPGPERAAAEAALAGLAPEPWAVRAGAVGLAAAIALTAWTVLRGTP